MGWIIFFGILLLILLILMIPVRAVIDYKEKFTVKIKYLFFFTLTLIPGGKEKTKRKKKSKETIKEEEGISKENKPKTKHSLEEIIDMIIDAVKKYGAGAKMILNNIRFHRVELYWRISGEDAADCGIKYGKACAWLNSALAFFRNYIKIECAKFKIFPDFIADKDEIYGGIDIELNPLVVIIGIFRIAFVFLKDIFLKKKDCKQAENKTKTKYKGENLK